MAPDPTNSTPGTPYPETASGAKRAEKVPFYRIIPYNMLKRMAEAFQEGHEKYSEGVFNSNWKKGDAQFYVEAFDHVQDHLHAFYTLANDPALADVMGLTTEDHLGHAACGLAFLMYGQDMGFFDDAADDSAPVIDDNEPTLPPESVPAGGDPKQEGLNDAQGGPAETPDLSSRNWGGFSKWMRKNKKKD